MLSTTPFEIPAYLLELAKGLPARAMAVAGADHPIAMESARQAAEAGLIEPVLVGDPTVIAAIAADMGWDITAIRVIAADSEARASETAVALAGGGEVDALMKGHVHSDAIMRAALKRDAGLRTDRRASHIFHMTVPGSDRVLFITDGALNVAPDVATKVDIVRNAVNLARALGNAEPRVALLSGTEAVIESMPSSVEAVDVVKRARECVGSEAIIDGPFAFDNAVSPEAAALKRMDSPVAGNADILVVPNIETGNGLFKMMVYFMSGLAAGVVMGTKVPIVLTSRADPPEARLAAAAIAAIAAAQPEH
jgi:phosphate acetyltransferase